MGLVVVDFGWVVGCRWLGCLVRILVELCLR